MFIRCVYTKFEKTRPIEGGAVGAFPDSKTLDNIRAEFFVRRQCKEPRQTVFILPMFCSFPFERYMTALVSKFMMSQENSVDLSRSVKDVLQAAQVPQEFVTEPIIEEKITEVYVQVYEKEIVEVPQVCRVLCLLVSSH